MFVMCLCYCVLCVFVVKPLVVIGAKGVRWVGAGARAQVGNSPRIRLDKVGYTDFIIKDFIKKSTLSRIPRFARNSLYQDPKFALNFTRNSLYQGPDFA